MTSRNTKIIRALIHHSSSYIKPLIFGLIVWLYLFLAPSILSVYMTRLPIPLAYSHLMAVLILVTTGLILAPRNKYKKSIAVALFSPIIAMIVFLVCLVIYWKQTVTILIARSFFSRSPLPFKWRFAIPVIFYITTIILVYTRLEMIAWVIFIAGPTYLVIHLVQRGYSMIIKSKFHDPADEGFTKVVNRCHELAQKIVQSDYNIQEKSEKNSAKQDVAINLAILRGVRSTFGSRSVFIYGTIAVSSILYTILLCSMTFASMMISINVLWSGSIVINGSPLLLWTDAVYIACQFFFQNAPDGLIWTGKGARLVHLGLMILSYAVFALFIAQIIMQTYNKFWTQSERIRGNIEKAIQSVESVLHTVANQTYDQLVADVRRESLIIGDMIEWLSGDTHEDDRLLE